ncbi:hypothetical protein HBI56_004480 [Parastagonospora nodorum]|uniref:Uncharacterized protein n=1 Tax=Phaeosphaeria nodorum (strain SN15 / ATCC MYA-4574 / FGSC 10173) TaxID=321614 RepID=A0A7U2EQM6_PHANO|nr:hypothetical protein HBH56_136570 [Parastagonospora nodorum]QRC91270.1 hypothetical protein JI435_300460 [Parastagonospora nodorum SN15]KAH3927979.1 hypothetical protein HBH54_141700 [Parastagonospora nodorum]KAH3948829.1 hypothetical protein HBH53_091680 [Parastagonospora nodorum]KAH3972456.1 hypothetical protein HBH52_153520 [Parastagonospora nodorum]
MPRTTTDPPSASSPNEIELICIYLFFTQRAFWRIISIFTSIIIRIIYILQHLNTDHHQHRNAHFTGPRPSTQLTAAFRTN